MQDFICPSNHIGSKALMLSGKLDEFIKDCAIAYISPAGGGPGFDHTHEHDHIFTVISGAVVVRISKEEHVPFQGESIYVSGHKSHSVWNRSSIEAKVIGVSVTPSNNITKS